MIRPWAGPDSPRMFESDWLDALSRTHFLFVAIVFIPAVVGLAGMGLWRGVSLPATAGIALCGLVAWTLTEYWLHRTLFHWVPKATWGPRVHFLLHGVHHTHPNDRYRLVLPPGASLPLFVMFLFLWVTLFGRFGWAFHAGFTSGYVTYDLMHYYVHHGKPRAKWLRRLQGHHMSHHFNKRFANKRFGVSSPLWDIVFGTRD